MADTTHPEVAQPAEMTREQMCREWLGLRNPTPSYYGLLGLPELETDETAVLHAGRRVKRKVRAYQIGLYRKQALELLAEIGQAVSVLTNKEKKLAYDRDLMKRWQSAVEELYRTHCEGAPREPEVLEAWLTACRLRGVPVTRLMPYLMRTLERRAKDWPASGAHQLSLPINLWIHRDVVVLGQCLHVGTLETRVEAVKRVQKVLGIPEGMARLVAEEVGRGLHLFAQTRLVIEAKKDPDAVLARIGRRLHRHGGHLGHKAKVMTAVARLLGRHKGDLDQVLVRLDEPPVELSSAQLAARAARRAKQRVHKAKHRAGEVRRVAAQWVTNRPQLLIGAALLVGVLVLLMAFLAAAGVWNPLGSTPPPAQKPVVDTTLPGLDLPPVDEVSIDVLKGLRDLSKKYPVGQVRRPPGEPASTTPDVGRRPGPGDNGTGTDDSPSKIRFFGVDGGKRSSPVPTSNPLTPPAPPDKAPAPAP